MTEKVGVANDSIVAEDGSMGDEEASYPAKADSDEECSSDSVGIKNIIEQNKSELEANIVVVEQSGLSDVSCVVCSEVLVDPCTLHCGHSFCLLCLASMWKKMNMAAASNLKCPVCREPWGSYPGVNIQLRSLIERGYAAEVALRRNQYSESDLSSVHLYKQAKSKTYTQDQAVLLRFQQQRRILLVLALVLCGTFVLMVGVVLLAVSMVGPAGEYMRKPVSHWSHDDVMAWITGLGNWAHHNISLTFQKEKISGPQLLVLDQEVLKTFGIHNKFQMESLLLALQQLKDTDRSAPRNYKEFVAAHRKEALILALLYKLWPRLSFLYMYWFNYYLVFEPIWKTTLTYSLHEEQQETLSSEYPSNWQLLLFAVEVVLVPHYVVGMCVWQWSSSHRLLSAAILIHCLWTTQREAKLTLSYLSSRQRHEWRRDVRELVLTCIFSVASCVLLVLATLLLWPVVPYFICNLIQTGLIGHTAFIIATKTLKLLFIRRRQQQIRRPQREGVP